MPAQKSKKPAQAAAKAKSQTWRLKKLEDLTLLLGNEKKALATISRDQKVFELPLTLPTDVNTWRLSQVPHLPSARSSAWLDGD